MEPARTADTRSGPALMAIGYSSTIAEMTCNGWDLEGEDTFTKSENYGESY